MPTSTTPLGGHARPVAPGFRELFLPKLVTVLGEGYGLKDLRVDGFAGLTVAIVALPLSMAIAIAAGVSPERGLYTAIVGGFLISMMGGSRFQIGGPAAAFIALVAMTVEKHGYEGLALATLMAGLIMLAIGFLQLGTYIKYIPFPVTVGFTAGIAVIILASQIRDLIGLDIAHEPSEFLPKIKAIVAAIGTFNPATIAIAALSFTTILLVRRLRPAWPTLLISVALATLVTYFLSLPVMTIGSRFGEIPSGLPLPSLPVISIDRIAAVFPDAVAIALLGSIESLLSAVVADGMTGRRHRSNCELVAQGVGNIGSVIFGGVPVTGTIARTATNIRAGARGPVAGMFHALYLLIFVLIAMPLVAYIPLASLAGVLVVVAWSMADKADFAMLLRVSRADAVILLATFLLTIFVDLLTGIAAGVVIGALVFVDRMAQTVQVNGKGRSLIAEDRPDSENGRARFDQLGLDSDVMVYRISGAFFFGATSQVGIILDRVVEKPRAFILDFSEVPFIDITAARALGTFVAKLRRHRTIVLLANVKPTLRRPLTHGGLIKPHVRYVKNVQTGIEEARRLARLKAAS